MGTGWESCLGGNGEEDQEKKGAGRGQRGVGWLMGSFRHMSPDLNTDNSHKTAGLCGLELCPRPLLSSQLYDADTADACGRCRDRLPR